MNAITPISQSVVQTCTIHLHGNLRNNFGDSVVVPGSTVALAIRNMLIKNPKMRFALEEGEYRVVRGSPEGGIDLDKTMLHMQVGPARQIHLFPVAAGSGGSHGGTIKTVLGAVLIVASFALYVSGAGAPLASALDSATGLTVSGAGLLGTIGLFGASLLLGGLSRLISPQPGLGASYLINGNLNTAQQGTPVPLVYGRCRVGSLIVASSYSAEDYNTSTSDYEGAGAYWNSTGGYSGALDAFDTGNPLPSGAQGKGGGGGKSGGASGVEAPNTLESKSVVRIIDIVSEGPITGLVNGPQGIFFNNTPLMNADGTWNFRGVSWYILYGTPDQPAVSGYPSATETTVVNEQCFHGTPIIIQVESTTATQCRVTIELPALYATNTQNGDINPSSLSLAIAVAPVSGTTIGPYSTAVADTINGKCTSPYQRSYVFSLPYAGAGITNWNIQLIKGTAESSVSTTINTLYWYSYDLITNNQIAYADSAGFALEIDSEAFGSVLPARTYLIDGIIVECPANYDAATRVYNTTGPGTSGGTWDYATFTAETTSNPAWILHDFMTNARYGLGLSASQLETSLVQLYEISQYCDALVNDADSGTEPRYELNGVFNQRMSAFQLMQAIAGTFRGTVYWAGGQVCVTADMPQSPVKIYSAANVIDGNFVYEGTSLKTRHTMANCHFVDPNNQYLPGVEIAELPAQIAQRGIFAADVLGFGVTSRGLAHRLGNWLLYTENFQTQTVTFSVGWDSAGVAPGNLILIADSNIATIRMGGRLRTGSTVSQLLFDMVFEPASGQTYTATVVLQDGTLAVAVAITSFGSGTTSTGVPYTTANLGSELASAPLAGAVFILQDAASPATEWQVVGISETQRGIFEIVAAQYNPNKFELVENLQTLNIPVFSTVPAQLISALAAPSNITAITTLAGQGVTTLVLTTVSWTVPNDKRIVQYQVSVVNSEGTTVSVLMATGASVAIDNLAPDTYYFAVRSIGTNGSTSSWAYSSSFSVSGISANAPPAATGLTAIGGVSQVYLQWVASTQRDVAYYNIWRSDTSTAPHQSGSIAALIGTTAGTAYMDGDTGTLAPGTYWYYWVEPVTSTGVVGALSADVEVLIAYVTSGDLAAAAISSLAAFASQFQPIYVWSGASLPADPAAIGGALTLVWQQNFLLYSWNATTSTWVSTVAQLSASSITAGTLNAGVVLGSLASFGNLQVTRALIANGVIGDMASSTGTSPSITLSVDNGDSVVTLAAEAYFEVNTGTSAYYTVNLQITRDGTAIFNEDFDFGGVNTSLSFCAPMLVNDQPGSGSHTYAFSWSVVGTFGTVYACSLTSASIQALAVQK